MFVVWWRLAWNAFNTVRFAAFSAWGVDNSEFVFSTGDFRWFFITWASFFFEEAFERFPDTGISVTAGFVRISDFVGFSFEVEANFAWIVVSCCCWSDGGSSCGGA
jgi:hypothetical protein